MRYARVLRNKVSNSHYIIMRHLLTLWPICLQGEMGSFDELTSNGLSAPPYLLCFFIMIATSFLSDHFKVRGPFACFFAIVAAVGYIVLAAVYTFLLELWLAIDHEDLHSCNNHT